MKLLTNERCKYHPWSKNGYVQQIDLKFLKSISNPESSDLLCGAVVHQDQVWSKIEKNGMKEPLLVIVGYELPTPNVSLCYTLGIGFSFAIFKGITVQ